MQEQEQEPNDQLIIMPLNRHEPWKAPEQSVVVTSSRLNVVIDCCKKEKNRIKERQIRQGRGK